MVWYDKAVAGGSDGVFTLRHLTLGANIRHVLSFSFLIY